MRKPFRDNRDRRSRGKGVTTRHYKTYLLNKPYGYLSQFTSEGNHPGLKELLYVPKDVYSLGRLDRDSEGLLLLTNDPSLNQRILHPRNHIAKTYWCQVEGEFSDDAIRSFNLGVTFSIKGKAVTTLPAQVKRLDNFDLWERNPPVRFRANIPTSWIEVTIREGKNRQVRRMCAAVGFPALRLVRWSIGPFDIDGLQSGDVMEIPHGEFLQKLSKYEI